MRTKKVNHFKNEPKKPNKSYWKEIKGNCSNLSDCVLCVFVNEKGIRRFVAETVDELRHQFVGTNSLHVAIERVPHSALFVDFERVGFEGSLLADREVQPTVRWQMTENDGRRCASHKIVFVPKHRNKRILFLLTALEVLEELWEELGILDGVGEVGGGAVVEVEHSFEIDIKVVTVFHDDTHKGTLLSSHHRRCFAQITHSSEHWRNVHLIIFDNFVYYNNQKVNRLSHWITITLNCSFIIYTAF